MIDFLLKCAKNICIRFFLLEMNMTIKEAKNGENIELNIDGRLDTTTAPQLESRVKECVKGAKLLILNLEKVEYISSAGLRVVLLSHKLMAGAGGKMVIKNPSSFCTQVFEATGMDGVLSIAATSGF